jgi:hypothetical protein
MSSSTIGFLIFIVLCGLYGLVERYLEYREDTAEYRKEVADREKDSGNDKLLEKRVETLETIATSADEELNERLRKL